MESKEMYNIVQILRRKSTYEKGTIDKTTIANKMNTSRTTVSRILSEMEAASLITVSPAISSDSEGLQKKSNIVLRSDFGYALGIAVGTRHIRAVLLDMDCKLVCINNLCNGGFFAECKKIISDDGGRITDDTFIFPLKEHTLDEIVDYLYKIIIDAIHFHDHPNNLLGIGIAFPGTVNHKTQQIIFCPNFPALTGKKISDIISNKQLNKLAHRNISIVIDDTAKGALVSEREHLYTSSDSAHRDLANKPNIGVVYMGTGISYAVSFDGRIARGASGGCTELGHIQVPPAPKQKQKNRSKYDLEASVDIIRTNGPSTEGENDSEKCSSDSSSVAGQQLTTYKCTCGRYNCLEAMLRKNVFSAVSLEEYWKKTSIEALSVFEINQPDEYNNLKYYVGYIMNLLINMLNLDVLIFTGRIFTHVPGIRDELNTIKGIHTLAHAGADCTVLPGQLTTNTVAQGMAMQVFAQYFGAIDVTWPTE